MFTLLFYNEETYEIYSSHTIKDPIIESEDEIKYEDGVFELVSAPYVLLLGEVEKERGEDVSDVLEEDVSDWFRIREASQVDLLEFRLNQLIENLEGGTT